MGTTKRTIRIADPLWERVRGVAHEQGESATDVVRDALIAYVALDSTSPDTGDDDS